MNRDTCFYHPSKEAYAKCSRCGRLICLADSQKVTTVNTRQSHHGTGQNRSTNVSHTSYHQMHCIPCNTQRMFKAKK